MAATVQVRISTQAQAMVSEIAVLSLCDGVEVESMNEIVERLIARHCIHLIFDYSAVHFCSSVEIAQVLHSRLLLLEYGGAVHVASLPPMVQNVFRALRLERLFALDRDVQGILAEYGHDQ